MDRGLDAAVALVNRRLGGMDVCHRVERGTYGPEVPADLRRVLDVISVDQQLRELAASSRRSAEVYAHLARDADALTRGVESLQADVIALFRGNLASQGPPSPS